MTDKSWVHDIYVAIRVSKMAEEVSYGAAKKWGEDALLAGFAILPNHLIAINQFLPSEQKLSPTEIVVLLNVVSFWWGAEKMPFPSNITLAMRCGISSRQVQRAIKALEARGLVRRRVRFSATGTRMTNELDLRGLVSVINTLARQTPDAFKVRKGLRRIKKPSPTSDEGASSA